MNNTQHSCSVCESRINDDEIDLFELVMSIWAGKWIIVAFVIVFVIAGFGYSKLATPVFQVSSQFQTNLYPVRASQNCNIGNLRCFDTLADQEASKFFTSWSLTKGSLTKSLSAVNSLDAYNKEFTKANNTLTKQLLNNAKQELQAIDELPLEIKSSEHVAISTLNAKKTIIAIEQNKQQALSLSPVSISKKSPKTKLILVLSVLLGGMLGCFVILVRQAIGNYKSKQKS